MRLILALVLTSIGILFACSASRFATSPAPVTSNEPMTQSSAPSIVSSTQEKQACALKLSQAPTLKGLKLGMTPDEVLAVFPGSQDDAELRSMLSQPPSRFGNSTFVITPAKYGDNREFNEISRVMFTTLDGRVFTFTLSYNGPQWPHIDKFVEKFVEGKDLPATDQWAPYVGMDDQLKTLTCADFAIRIFAGGEGGNLNYVLMQDLEADKKLKERRAKARATATPSPEKQ